MSFVVRSLQARGITELIPTVRIESQHSTGVPTCHEFPWFFSFWRNRGLKSEVVDEVHVSFDLFGKKTPYWQIFKNLFGKDSCGHGNTSSVQILWNLADRKSVKSCVIYLTKKKQNFGMRSGSRFCADRAQNLLDSSRQHSRSAPNFIQIRSLPAEL